MLLPWQRDVTLLSMPTTRPWILQNLRNYMRMTKPEIRVKQVCLPRTMSNVTNNKNEL